MRNHQFAGLEAKELYFTGLSKAYKINRPPPCRDQSENEGPLKERDRIISDLCCTDVHDINYAVNQQVSAGLCWLNCSGSCKMG